MTDRPDLKKLEDEASALAVLLVDDPDNSEQLRQLKIWLHTSALHAEVWARTCRVYEALGRLPSVTQEQWTKRAPDERRPKRRFARSMSVRNALVSLAGAFCLLLLLLPRLTLQLAADHVSGTGEQRTHLLGDGSTLTLAPESALDIRYSDGERRVRLLKGAAFFAVQRDSERPFIVQAGSTRIAVLGTAFAVDMSDSGTLVSAAHGRVRVEDHSVTPAASADLTAGDRLAVTWGEGASLTSIAVDDVARWRSGELIARDLPVSELVDSFRPYYGGVIVITEPFASQRVTGLYRLDDPVSTLRDMARAHGARVREIGPWLLMLSQ